MRAGCCVCWCMSTWVVVVAVAVAVAVAVSPAAAGGEGGSEQQGVRCQAGYGTAAAGGWVDVPAARVNDDYCDCPVDGLDEPLTSACPVGKFKCANRGYIPISIPSSFVNDGICDCCDGSDEYAGKVKCKNACTELGAAERIAAKAQLDAAIQGLEERKSLSTSGTASYSEMKVQADAVRVQLNEAKEEVARLEKIKDDIQELEDKKAEELNQAHHVDEPTKDANNEPAEPINEQPSGDGDAPIDPDDIIMEELDPNKNLPEEERLNDIVPPVEEEKAAEIPAEEPQYNPVDDPELAPFKEATKKAEDELSAARSRERSLQSDLDKADKFLEKDYGEDHCFVYLVDQCYSVDVEQYTYKVCPFDKASQDSSGSSTSLGTWEHWIGDHAVMEYTKGVHCWNGPDRSAKVEVVCGAKTELISASEPAKCEYHMVLTTPCACSDALVAERKAKYDQFVV
ncbi:glucosidase 2 subunit beta [Pelomyxa schiedti]|nr:glucosidase 2 subunit beta [Pelomyxa schiedti]